jgi:hypothetical protein
MRRRPQDRIRPAEPPHCKCVHYADTPTWVGKRRTGSGLSGHSSPLIGNLFTRVGGCIHSETLRTTKMGRKRVGVERLHLSHVD